MISKKGDGITIDGRDWTVEGQGPPPGSFGVVVPVRDGAGTLRPVLKHFNLTRLDEFSRTMRNVLPRYEREFRAEVEAYTRLATRYPDPHAVNVARILQHGRIQAVRAVDPRMQRLVGTPALVMERCQANLADLIDTGSPLLCNLFGLLGLARALVRALSALADLGDGDSQGVHRDVKPMNILLTAEGIFVLADFGCWRAVTESGSASAVGAPDHLAPEQWAGCVKVDQRRIDLYALGLVLYEVALSVLPHAQLPDNRADAPTRGCILSAGERARLRQRLASLPASSAGAGATTVVSAQGAEPSQHIGLGDFIIACLEVDPARRLDLAEAHERLETLAHPPCRDEVRSTAPPPEAQNAARVLPCRRAAAAAAAFSAIGAAILAFPPHVALATAGLPVAGAVSRHSGAADVPARPLCPLPGGGVGVPSGEALLVDVKVDRMGELRGTVPWIALGADSADPQREVVAAAKPGQGCTPGADHGRWRCQVPVTSAPRDLWLVVAAEDRWGVAASSVAMPLRVLPPHMPCR